MKWEDGEKNGPADEQLWQVILLLLLSLLLLI
jgi:hypothetical protein